MIERVVKAITESGLWQRHEVPGPGPDYAWSLDPSLLLVSREVSNHACQNCGHQVTTSSADELAAKLARRRELNGEKGQGA